jgi:hypothetical protein
MPPVEGGLALTFPEPQISGATWRRFHRASAGGEGISDGQRRARASGLARGRPRLIGRQDTGPCRRSLHDAGAASPRGAHMSDNRTRKPLAICLLQTGAPFDGVKVVTKGRSVCTWRKRTFGRRRGVRVLT